MKVDAKDSFQRRTQVIPAMIKLPDWTGRIPEIRAALGRVTTKFIDRRQLERLFGVSAGQARRLITRMGPMLHGNSLVVDAEDILKMLSEIERDQEVRDLRRRLTEKSAELEQAQQNQKDRGAAFEGGRVVSAARHPTTG
jgi:hypothetical protein